MNSGFQSRSIRSCGIRYLVPGVPVLGVPGTSCQHRFWRHKVWMSETLDVQCTTRWIIHDRPSIIAPTILNRSTRKRYPTVKTSSPRQATFSILAKIQAPKCPSSTWCPAPCHSLWYPAGDTALAILATIAGLEHDGGISLYTFGQPSIPVCKMISLYTLCQPNV